MENYSTQMEARQQGGGSFSTYNLDAGSLVDDDFLFLDHNLPSIDSIASDFSAFLDSAGPNGSLLPADEWSGTTNTLPDTPSSHQQQLQHGLEGSSPLQSQLQGPVIQAKQQQQPLQQHQQQQQPPQQFVFESHAPPPSQPSAPDVLSGQHSAHGVDQMDSLRQPQSQARPGALHLENQARHANFPSRQVLLNGSTPQQSLPPAPSAASAGAGNTAREMVVEGAGFQGVQSETSGMESNFSGQRNFESLQGRQLPGNMPGFQGQMEGSQAGLRLSFPRGLMANGHFGMTGSTPQLPIQGQQAAMNHLPGADADGNGVALQSQLINNQTNFSGQFMSKVNNRQSIIPGHALSNIPSFQLQPSSHQLQLQGQTKLHPQLMNQQVINQGLLQPRQIQLGSQPSVFSSPQQQSSYQLLQSQGYQMHPNAGNHLPIGRQMFPQMQPRLQSPLIQGLRYGGALGSRQLGPQIVGPQIGTGVPEMGTRYPPSGTNAAKCAQVFMLYIQEQRKRPQDNNINFWRAFVHKYFAPGATKRWCLTSYSTTPVGRHAQGLFPMDYWYCNLCGIQPGRGFESGTDVLPRLFKIKYDSGLLDELLFLDVATEKYSVPSGKVVLEYARAVHESVFLELRVIRHGKLRITFNSQFKICSWEFCTKAHEEVVPRKNLLQQVHQLASLVIESDQENFDKSAENLKSHCNAFTKAAKQLAVQLDAPMVNDLGFSKRYVRCLQIAEVVNSMKDLISFERKTGLGPVESLKRFPTVKKLQMEGGLAGLPPSLSLTQMITELTQGTTSLQSSTVTRLQSESMSEAQDQGDGNQQAHSSSVFKGMEAAAAGPPVNQQRSSMESRLQHLLQSSSEAFNQIQPSQAAQSIGSQLASPSQAPAVVAQAPGKQQQQQQQAVASNQIGGGAAQQQQNFQPVVLKSGAAKSSLSQPHQSSLPGTPQSEMSDMRSNT
ncbi:transcriptional corepressor SEUSS [Selaginella moellendorffii]|uniref:transcriptional corepressor SEUSS n=1 Tax=Selaginella moellendorffii TaxID=88036 RepID=UPI000D1C2AD5|nr:transcriptional corepressor SEUSS [Selaginella moellendorffii]|eukprot:XP_024520157.1 transcriptional corepressor SEUSS [Selaginella moellendorffii]